MFRFDEAAHRYYLHEREIPGVTSVLQQVQDFSRVPPDVLEQKRQIGQALHRAIELGDEIDPSSLDERVQPYYDAWRRFLAETGFVVLISEQQVCSRKYQYGGTLDAIGTLNRREVLVDFKTSWDLHPAVGPQTAAYRHAASEDDICDQGVPRYALQLRRDRTYRLEPLRDPADLAVFLAALSLFKWRKQHGI